MARLTINWNRFQRNLKQFAQDLGKDVRTVAYDAMATGCNVAMQQTYPHSTSARGGNGTVKRDIEKVFITPRTLDRFLSTPRLKKRVLEIESGLHIPGGAKAAYRALMLNFSKQIVTMDFVSPNFHQSQRNSKGRISGRISRAFVTQRDDVTRYVKDVQTHVGKAKSGWLAGAKLFGLRQDVPAFVLRHGGGAGSARDALRIDSSGMPHGYLSATNNDNGAAQIQKRWDVVGRAERASFKSMEKKVEYEISKRNRTNLG